MDDAGFRIGGEQVRHQVAEEDVQRHLLARRRIELPLDAPDQLKLRRCVGQDHARDRIDDLTLLQRQHGADHLDVVRDPGAAIH